jgi:signal transduction histidine kinase
MGIASDITERKRIEDHREDLIRELEAKNAELERFTYAVSHDLKSPLITVKGFLSLIEHEAAAGEYGNLSGYMERVNRATDKMSDLLDDLLQLSRAGRHTHPHEEIRLNVLVRDVLDMLSGRIAARQAQVAVAPDLPVVQAVRPRLSQLLENLIDNAVKFVPSGTVPRLDIGALPRDSDTVVFVRDNGIGIPPEDQQRVFELFEKLDQTTDGSGIGLALARRIVESHGGRIWVESEGRGRGCTFAFSLPRTPAQPGAASSDPGSAGRQGARARRKPCSGQITNAGT